MLDAIEKLISPLLSELTNKVAEVYPKFTLDELKKKLEPVTSELQAKIFAAVVGGKDISDEIIPAVTAVVTDLYGDFGGANESDDEDDL